METISPDLHFPTDIKLSSSPLVEAWLEIRWKLAEGNIPGSRTDPVFPFALGVFYESIKGDFRHREPLPASEAPEGFLPYVIQYQFRPAPDEWPVFQLGHGIATVNFTSPYTWEDFKARAIYLRERLASAYADAELTVQNLVLRYRNVVEFDYLSSDILYYLRNTLNTAFVPPKHIPGMLAAPRYPTHVNTSLTYDLRRPSGKGVMKFASGYRKSDGKESDQSSGDRVIIFDLEVHSKNTENEYWSSAEAYDVWLSSAHAVIHEWFFAIIDGSLRKSFD